MRCPCTRQRNCKFNRTFHNNDPNCGRKRKKRADKNFAASNPHRLVLWAVACQSFRQFGVAENAPPRCVLWFEHHLVPPALCYAGRGFSLHHYRQNFHSMIAVVVGERAHDQPNALTVLEVGHVRSPLTPGPCHEVAWWATSEMAQRKSERKKKITDFATKSCCHQSTIQTQ